MSKTGRCTVAALGIVMAGHVLFSWGVGRIQAQSRPQESRTAYQYVGVQQTIARIDETTGRIEILSKVGESRASLLTQDARVWEWRRVQVRERTTRPPGRGGHLDETAKPEGSDKPGDEPRSGNESADL